MSPIPRRCARYPLYALLLVPYRLLSCVLPACLTAYRLPIHLLPLFAWTPTVDPYFPPHFRRTHAYIHAFVSLLPRRLLPTAHPSATRHSHRPPTPAHHTQRPAHLPAPAPASGRPCAVHTRRSPPAANPMGIPPHATNLNYFQFTQKRPPLRRSIRPSARPAGPCQVHAYRCLLITARRVMYVCIVVVVLLRYAAFLAISLTPRVRLRLRITLTLSCAGAPWVCTGTHID
ncbi:hypothetical protein HYPSUDRAFT_290882 [Hypholoma sublateritium FD-334 SS-4]|uniref:Uncharacterized protein n=1 Tax=Hypholoma sublateritium (strain FD-334 SS-4) TaxID=945553 RepID=A0A0D2P807_HYPSF|nr:hypothetical protein HYPSUDRAFT_290882 [Hypholoma sublateritium FD-334 SS-4]